MEVQKGNFICWNIMFLHYFLRYFGPILLLISSSSATFERPIGVGLKDNTAIWRGKPFVKMNPALKDYRICADDLHWSEDIADAICRYRGFEGVMAIEEYSSNPGYDYAVCKLDEGGGRTPIVCEPIAECEEAPTISCLLPGYFGCFVHTESSPFFAEGGLGPGEPDETPYDIQSCAEACVQYPYFGLTNSEVCICGVVINNQADEGVCDLACVSNELQTCGGEDAISVYGGTVIGKCTSSQTSQDLLPNQPVFVSSPQFPDRYTPGSSCTWTLVVDVEETHSLQVTATVDLPPSAEDYVEVSSESNKFYMYLRGTSDTSGLSLSPYSVLQDTITVNFTSCGIYHGSFLIRFSLTPLSHRPTSQPLITDTSSHLTRAPSPSSSFSLSSSREMSSTTMLGTTNYNPLVSSGTLHTERHPTSTTTSSSTATRRPGLSDLSTILSESSPPAIQPSTHFTDLLMSTITSGQTKIIPESAASINELAIYAGVGATVALVVLLAVAIIFALFRGRIGGSEKPAGLVGYHANGTVDMVNPSYTPTSPLPKDQFATEDGHHIYATIPEHDYLVPDPTDPVKIGEEKLKNGSSGINSGVKSNDYLVVL